MKPIYFVSPLHSSALVLFATLLSQTNSVSAQASNIVPDNTLGSENSVVNPRDENSDRIEGGAVRGQNLFHSFQEFNVDEGRGVYFANPDAVSNIFSRVTGNSQSNILGTLGVDGAANLYLVNPNGIVFGENSALDVQGSFTATTADGIEFGDNGLFSAVAPGESLLTISVPLGLQFGSSPGDIINSSKFPGNTDDNVGLQVATGENLTIVGGEVRFEAGEATASGGKINIGGLGAAGTVGTSDDGSLSFPENVQRADIILSNAADVDVRGTGGGSININARNLRMEAGEFGSSQIRAGITVDSTSSEAQGGNITLDANNLIIDNSFVFNDIEEGGVGNGGDINFIAGFVDITNGSLVTAVTDGQGNAGGINIFADESVNISSGNGDTFIFNNIGSNTRGNTRGINITTGSLFVNNGAQIQSLTEGEGDPGKIVINASDNVSFNGRNANDSPTGAFSLVFGGTGDAGGIDIFARSLSITNRAQLNGDTRGIGNGGDINIQVEEDVKLVNSIIIAEITEGSGVGEGGSITIKTGGSLILQDGSSLLADTENIGNAGNINIEAREEIILKGSGPSSLDLNSIVPSQITATVDSFEGSRGEGGNINISTPFLSIADSGFIRTSTFGLGNAGNIEIEADNISLDGFIASSSETDFDAGDITFNVANSLQATASSISTSSTQSSGGNLTVTTSNIQLKGNSDLTTDIALGEGSGGNIKITADSIVAFDDSDIFASAPEGQGGNITLDTSAFFAENFTLNSLTADSDDLDLNARADVNATGAVSSGLVQIPDVSFIQNSLIELPDNSLNTDELVANSCVVPVGNRSQGKFIITGGESLPVRPGGNLPSKYPTGEVRGASKDNTSSWQPGEPIIEAQDAYRLANGKWVLSRECSQ